MNVHIFNGCLLAGWVLIVAGVGLVHIPSAFIVGGALLVLLTMWVASKAGVQPNAPKPPKAGD